MTQTGFANSIVNLMLGWLKALAHWVLKLFNLAGSGGSPLEWLSENWLKLLIILLIVGVVMDWLIWMIRWRPYWVWFRKKRIIVNDERILSEKDLRRDDFESLDDLFEQEYVVPSTVVKRRQTGSETGRSGSTSAAKRGKTSAVVSEARRPARKARSAATSREKHRDVFNEGLFEVGHDRDDYSDFYEDEVFNVSSLPETAEPERRPRKKRK